MPAFIRLAPVPNVIALIPLCYAITQITVGRRGEVDQQLRGIAEIAGQKQSKPIKNTTIDIGVHPSTIGLRLRRGDPRDALIPEALQRSKYRGWKDLAQQTFPTLFLLSPTPSSLSPQRQFIYIRSTNIGIWAAYKYMKDQPITELDYVWIQSKT